MFTRPFSLSGKWRRHPATPRANDILMKLAIEEACVEGCRWFHMGESSGVGSLIRWKERFGARPMMYEEFRVKGSRGHRQGDRLSSYINARVYSEVATTE
jgi:hypothetical protein